MTTLEPSLSSWVSTVAFCHTVTSSNPQACLLSNSHLEVNYNTHFYNKAGSQNYFKNKWIMSLYLNRDLHHCLALKSLISPVFRIRKWRAKTIKWFVTGLSVINKQEIGAPEFRARYSWQSFFVRSLSRCLFCDHSSQPKILCPRPPHHVTNLLWLFLVQFLHWIQTGLDTFYSQTSECFIIIFSYSWAMSNLRAIYNPIVIPSILLGWSNDGPCTW